MRSLPIVLFACLLTGCADYLNHNDSVTLAQGDANRYNTMLQTVDPLNPKSYDTHIKGDGARGVAVYNNYRYGDGGNCATPNDTAADGSNCGGRAASVKPGGAP